MSKTLSYFVTLYFYLPLLLYATTINTLPIILSVFICYKNCTLEDCMRYELLLLFSLCAQGLCMEQKPQEEQSSKKDKPSKTSKYEQLKKPRMKRTTAKCPMCGKRCVSLDHHRCEKTLLRDYFTKNEAALRNSAEFDKLIEQAKQKFFFLVNNT
jgi:hypothetical protein